MRDYKELDKIANSGRINGDYDVLEQLYLYAIYYALNSWRNGDMTTDEIIKFKENIVKEIDYILETKELRKQHIKEMQDDQKLAQKYKINIVKSLADECTLMSIINKMVDCISVLTRDRAFKDTCLKRLEKYD